ncbi:MAG: flagellar biosynthesis protein FlhF [Gammaproteobacteria bacterium]|nr:flagellar biosynthesis protein FlhF [Gammaproteobacteria bacterium]
MKIKRFFASEMREAIRQVKDELGADAVILSNNKVDGGIELVAAIDYDEETIHRTLNSDSFQDSRSNPQAHGQQSISAVTKKKKRSVFAKIKKPKVTPRLEDSIQDDVISFSRSSKGGHQERANALEETENNGFADLLKQSSQKQFVTTKQNHAMSNEQGVYTKQALKERKQPFISDFDNFDDTTESSSEETYPFDYESLVKEEQKRSHSKKDDFFTMKNDISSKANKQQVRSSRGKESQKVEWVQDPALTSMQEEIKSLRGILENQLSGLAWGSFSRSHPHQAELLSRLFRLGMKTSLSERIVKQLKNTESDSLEDSWRRVLSIIARNIPVTDDDLLDEGGIIALVGPTGVGKTTNIAKLAARFTLKYGAKNLALVTTDSYRVGAHEQLKTYGRILGVPVYVANDEEELKLVLSRLEDKQLVLVDTAGMSHRDLRLTQQLSMLRHSHETIKILAVLSASTQTLAMDEIIKTLKAEELDGCIASKVDESTSIGGIISILIENKLQLNYISDGQKVPEDIHQANTTDLLKQALEMVRQHPVSVNTDELAMSYSGGGLAHAAG